MACKKLISLFLADVILSAIHDSGTLLRFR